MRVAGKMVRAGVVAVCGDIEQMIGNPIDALMSGGSPAAAYAASSASPVACHLATHGAVGLAGGSWSNVDCSLARLPLPGQPQRR